MNHARTLLLLLSVVCTWACTVPTLEDLEKERPSGCDAAHACKPDWVCFEGQCLPKEGEGCTPGTTLACGNEARGECRPGTRVCGKDRTFGACMGEVVSTAEVCNGKDDDCDGTPDEELFQDCAKRVGVCSGARETCTSGAFGGCTDATYAQHSDRYQSFETTCDGQDNDCDGSEDGWTAGTLIIEQPGSAMLSAVSVDRGPSMRPTVLTLIPRNGDLEVRVISSEGIRAEEVLPSSAPDFFSTHPTLVADKDQVAAAWVEEKPASAQESAEYRVHMTLLDGSGERRLPITPPVFSDARKRLITNLQVVASNTRFLVLVTLFTSFSSQEVWAFTISRDLRTWSTPFALAESDPSNWLHAVAAGDPLNTFLVTYQTRNEGRQLGVITEAGILTRETSLAQYISAGERPFITPTAGLEPKHTIRYVENPLTGGDAWVMSIQCGTTATTAPCNPATRLTPSFPHRIEDMRMLTRPGQLNPNFAWLRWTDPKTGGPRQGVARITPSTVGQPLLVPLQPPAPRSEVPVLSPEGTFFLVYLQNPPPPQPLPGQADAKVLPLCLPPL